MQSISVTQNNCLGYSPTQILSAHCPVSFPATPHLFETFFWKVNGIAANNSWGGANVSRHADGL